MVKSKPINSLLLACCFFSIFIFFIVKICSYFCLSKPFVKGFSSQIFIRRVHRRQEVFTAFNNREPFLYWRDRNFRQRYYSIFAILLLLSVCVLAVSYLDCSSLQVNILNFKSANFSYS